MLKQTLFVVISVCAISNLQAGCFPGYFFEEHGTKSPQTNTAPYFADFPGTAHCAVSPTDAEKKRREQAAVAIAAHRAIQHSQTQELEKAENAVDVKG